MTTLTCSFHPTPEREMELQRLGHEIAELAAHLDAATARLLDLIRDFDAREGWGNGFRSCAEWLTWRIGLASGAAREHVRVALGERLDLGYAISVLHPLACRPSVSVSGDYVHAAR